MGASGEDTDGSDEHVTAKGRHTESRQLQLQLFRMEEYVEMILHFTRLEESGTDFVFDAYDLDEMIRKTIRKYASVFVQKKIAICYDTISARVLTDEKWFCFVLEQVLSNALKYTNHGSVTIAMETPGLLTIRDTGIGSHLKMCHAFLKKDIRGIMAEQTTNPLVWDYIYVNGQWTDCIMVFH